MSKPRSEREILIRRCYQEALTELRQNHDAEFHQILATVYERHGIEVHKRKSRIQTKKENASE